MDMFDFEELIADMLDITDDEREDPDYLPNMFYEDFELLMEDVYPLVNKLLEHTPTVTAGLSGKEFHAFVSKTSPVMLMKKEIKQ